MSNLASKAGEFTSVLTEHAMDQENLIRCYVHAGEMRPLVDEDFKDNRPHHRGSSRAGFHCYEDAGMTTGSFLSSQSLRFIVTGEKEAEDNAKRAFSGIRFIYNLGKEKKEGYFPKPYDRKISDQISRDQYLYVMSGLANYHRIANAEDRKEIENMVCRMADYWIDINYTDSYFGLPASSHLYDFMGSLFLGIMRIPYSLTGDEKYLREYERLFYEEKLGERMPETLREKFMRGETYDGATYFRQQENPVMMKCMAIDHLWDADRERRDLWAESLKSFWKNDMLVMLDRETCLNYFIMGFDPESGETFLTEPGVIEELKNPLNLSNLTWGGLRKTAGSAQTAYAAVVAGDRLKMREPVDIALRILEKLDITSFCGFTVPDEKHIPPGLSSKTNFLSACYVSYWLWAYWSGREKSLW